MIYALWIMVAGLTFATACLLAALVEMYRHLDQLRLAAKIADKPTELEINSVSLYDLPIESSVFRDNGSHGHDRMVFLFLSDSCTTCSEVVKSVPAKHTPRFHTIVNARSAEAGVSWLRSSGIEPSHLIRADSERVVATALGVTVVPSVVKFENGVVVGSHTVPSGRIVKTTMDWIHGIDEGVEEGQLATPQVPSVTMKESWNGGS